MKDVFADIEFEEGELELWRGTPQCRVSPMRWSYMFLGTAVFAAAFAWSFSENLPVDGLNEPLVRGFFILFALGCAIFPFLLARSTNNSQYLATDRRVIVCAPTLTGLGWDSYDYETVCAAKVEPMHNGLATLTFSYHFERTNGDNVTSKVLLYGIPADVAAALRDRAAI